MAKVSLFVVITLSFLTVPLPSFGQGMIGGSRDITPELRQLDKNLTQVNSSIKRFNKDVLPEIREMNKNLIQVSDHIKTLNGNLLKLNQSSTEYSEKMVSLTWWIIVLTFILVALTIVLVIDVGIRWHSRK